MWEQFQIILSFCCFKLKVDKTFQACNHNNLLHNHNKYLDSWYVFLMIVCRNHYSPFQICNNDLLTYLWDILPKMKCELQNNIANKNNIIMSEFYKNLSFYFNVTMRLKWTQLKTWNYVSINSFSAKIRRTVFYFKHYIKKTTTAENF